MAFHQLSSLSLNILALGWHNYISISEFENAKHNPGLGSVALSKREALGQQPEENHSWPTTVDKKHMHIGLVGMDENFWKVYSLSPK